MEKTTKFILRLTARLEIYTNLIVVPLAVYFTIIAGGISGDKVYIFIISAVITATFWMIFGIILRFIFLKKIFIMLNDEKCSKVDVKLKLLNYPTREGLIISVRWFFGVISSYLLCLSFVDLNMMESVPFIFTFLISISVNYVISIFTTENMMSEFLMDPSLSSVNLPRDSYKMFSLYRRTILIALTIIIDPIVILGYFFFLANERLVLFVNLPVHIFFVSLLTFCAIFAAVYESTVSMKSGLSLIVNALEKMEEGNLDVSPVPMLIRGEIGVISQYVNKLTYSLKNSEEMFSKAFRASPVGIAIISIKTGLFINVNESFLRITNYERSEIIGYSHEEIRLFRNTNESQRIEDILQVKDELRFYETEILTKTRGIRIVTISAELINLWNELCMIAAIEDITEKKQLEKELTLISEMERQKIGRDLHDDLGPHLIGIEVLNTVLIQNIKNGIIPVAKDIEKIRLLVKDAIGKTRRVAQGLCPVHLEDYGLESSLKELLLQVEDIYGISCYFNYNVFKLKVDISVLSNLYYIAHEAVYNAVKHSGAKTITMNFICSESIVTLEINDNGRGLSFKKNTGGMGLKIMQHRAQNIGAVLNIKSDNKGTTVILVCNILEERAYNG